MFTPDQERVLTDLANQRLQDEADAAQRETDMEAAAAAQAALDAQLADLQAQADALVAQALPGAKVTITAPE